MKLSNQLLILWTIRATGPVSRVKLQKQIALGWGFITSSIKELLHKQIVRELGAVNTGVGRRPVELDMNTERNHIVGLRLSSTNIRAVLHDVKGSIVRKSREFVYADALKIFEKMGYYLGIGIRNLINLFNPERIILSGRVAQAGKFFIASLQHTMEEHAWHISQKNIELSNLENGAVLGAAGVVL